MLAGLLTFEKMGKLTRTIDLVQSSYHERNLRCFAHGMTRSVNPNGMPNLLSIANVGDALGGNTSLDGQSLTFEKMGKLTRTIDLVQSSYHERNLRCFAHQVMCFLLERHRHWL
jgi:hypothetical protein